ncbi:hypothetical protein HN51_007579 [Arachis hypogaea]
MVHLHSLMLAKSNHESFSFSTSVKVLYIFIHTVFCFCTSERFPILFFVPSNHNSVIFEDGGSRLPLFKLPSIQKENIDLGGSAINDACIYIHLGALKGEDEPSQ